VWAKTSNFMNSIPKLALEMKRKKEISSAADTDFHRRTSDFVRDICAGGG
jgi:hypothetical protein